MTAKEEFKEFISGLEGENLLRVLDMLARAVAGEDIDHIAASYGVYPDGKGGYIKIRD